MRALPLQTLRRTLVLLSLIALTSGCRSSSRWASLNPWSAGGQETSIAARTAPELPTAQASNPGGAAAPVAQAPASGGEAPAFVASAPAANEPPSSGYPTTGVADAALPASASQPATPSYPSTDQYAAAPASPMVTNPPMTSSPSSGGPYDPNGYTPPAASAASEPEDRYGDSRYAATESLPLNEMPPVAGIPGAGPANPGYDTDNRYGAVSNGLPLNAGLAGLPSPATATQPTATPERTVSQAAGQSAPIATTPGGYRPAGTSSYDPQVSVALRTATPNSNANATTPASGTPNTSAPAYPTTDGYRY